MSVRRLVVAIPLAAAVALGVPLLSSPALASGGGGDVRAAGRCSAHATWTLKAKHDNRRIEVEAEVDANRVGQTWAWRLSDDGTRFASGTARTVAPSGSFEVRRTAVDRPGTDRITVRATNAATGEVCTGVVSL
jgi:hypothetical protein